MRADPLGKSDAHRTGTSDASELNSTPSREVAGVWEDVLWFFGVTAFFLPRALLGSPLLATRDPIVDRVDRREVEVLDRDGPALDAAAEEPVELSSPVAVVLFDDILSSTTSGTSVLPFNESSGAVVNVVSAGVDSDVRSSGKSTFGTSPGGWMSILMASEPSTVPFSSIISSNILGLAKDTLPLGFFFLLGRFTSLEKTT